MFVGVDLPPSDGVRVVILSVFTSMERLLPSVLASIVLCFTHKRAKGNKEWARPTAGVFDQTCAEYCTACTIL